MRRMRGRWWVAAIRPRRDDDRVVWALPKGRIDPGERGAVTAVRETFEETGVRSRVLRKLGDVRYVYTESWDGGSGERVYKAVAYFLLAPVGGRLGELPEGMEIEVAEARWVPLDDAARVLSYGSEREVAVRALEALGGMPL